MRNIWLWKHEEKNMNSNPFFQAYIEWEELNSFWIEQIPEEQITPLYARTVLLCHQNRVEEAFTYLTASIQGLL